MRKQGKRAHVSRPVFRLVSYRRLLVEYLTGYCYGVEQTPTYSLCILSTGKAWLVLKEKELSTGHCKSIE